jgi:hypothetical protein
MPLPLPLRLLLLARAVVAARGMHAGLRRPVAAASARGRRGSWRAVLSGSPSISTRPLAHSRTRRPRHTRRGHCPRKGPLAMQPRTRTGPVVLRSAAGAPAQRAGASLRRAQHATMRRQQQRPQHPQQQQQQQAQQPLQQQQQQLEQQHSAGRMMLRARARLCAAPPAAIRASKPRPRTRTCSLLRKARRRRARCWQSASRCIAASNGPLSRARPRRALRRAP